MRTMNIFDYVAGDSLDIDFTVLTASGSVQNLTDCTAKWGVAKRISTMQFGPVLVTKTIGTGITVTNAALGTLKVSVSKGELTAVGDLIHELEVTLPSGASTTVASGILKSRAAVFPGA